MGSIIILNISVMKVFYESKIAKWLLWQGYSTITLGCFVFTKKSNENIDGYLDARTPFEFFRYYGKI